jgi:transposase
MIGVDLAKHVFHLHGATMSGHVLFRKRLSRGQFLSFMERQPACIVVMEACGGAHHWARELGRLGHEARLIAPGYVKPLIKRQKNDANDAEAIVEAAQRPGMRFVEVKSPEQQAVACLFRARKQLVEHRTALVNALRAHLYEFGLAFPAEAAGLTQARRVL